MSLMERIYNARLRGPNVTPYITCDELEALIDISEMDAVAIKHAHRLAMVLECVVMDRTSDRWWNEAMEAIGQYRSDMNYIHERHSPTHMGEPAIWEER